MTTQMAMLDDDPDDNPDINLDNNQVIKPDDNSKIKLRQHTTVNDNPDNNSVDKHIRQQFEKTSENELVCFVIWLSAGVLG
jgi:hypothetical protein